MNTALSWIKEYVPALSCTDQEYCDAMTLSGTKVEGYKRLDKNLEKIVVGEIRSISRHPDAEKLIICQVNIGDEEITIVTGASNVSEGDKVPVVLDGGKVAGGHDGSPLPADGISIKKGKLRGVESFGMMCSIEELGSSREYYPEAPEEGVYIFAKDAVVGSDAVKLLGLRDTVFEYEVTSNRVDCYSVLGIAREAAATFSLDFVPPIVTIDTEVDHVDDYVRVTVKDPDLCPRYVARVCKNIKIGPSPEWMQRRLASSGIRPINNLVDITNYVMEEFGQPMHAFDLSTIAGGQIIVKRAADGDEFITLDGQIRQLDSEILMICDEQKPVALAGIMGGENSKITDDVTTVLFESATFHGANIRKSAKRVGLRTDSSGKFEKGLDPNNALLAIQRACQLVELLGCGEVVAGVVDVCAPLPKLREIEFEPSRINALLGTQISEEMMLAIFRRLSIGYNKETNLLQIPSFRQDIEEFADIAEEVARFYGYDKIPATLPSGKATTGKLSYKLFVEGIVKDVVTGYGYSQGMNYSFESPKVFERLLLEEDAPERMAVTIMNPLGEDFSVMRTTPMHGMLSSLATNYNRRNKDVRLFELGNIYLPKQLPVTQLPEERMQLTLGMYGEGDFFDLKGVVETIFEALGMAERLKYTNASKKSYLHPGRQANIWYLNDCVGYIGQVHPEVCKRYALDTKVYVAVLDMPSFMDKVRFDRKYQGIAKYPSVSRDISLLFPAQIPVGDVEEVIRQRGGKILESVRLFDLYEGSQIQKGYKSVAYNITFRAKDRTLEEADIQGAMKKIINGLEGMGARLRE